MKQAKTDALERIARVLAALELSRNAHGSSRSAAELVDQTWEKHLADAAAVLHSLREADPEMVAVGDADIWMRMIRAALGEDLKTLSAEKRSWSQHGEIYQKPLG